MEVHQRGCELLAFKVMVWISCKQLEVGAAAAAAAAAACRRTYTRFPRDARLSCCCCVCCCCWGCWETACCCCHDDTLVGSRPPGDARACSALMSALVSWYSGSRKANDSSSGRMRDAFPLAPLSSPVLYAVGMAEKGSPCARRLGVATETTGVVRVCAACAPAASRWAFCRRGRQHVSGRRRPGEPVKRHAGNDHDVHGEKISGRHHASQQGSRLDGELHQRQFGFRFTGSFCQNPNVSASHLRLSFMSTFKYSTKLIHQDQKS